MPQPNRLSSARRADRPRAHEGTSETELAIFAAAERLLAQEPLHELSVAQLIAEAGISRATFYFYFSSKFAVLVGLLAQVMDEMFTVVQPFVNRAEDSSPEAALRASLGDGVELWARHRPALRAIHEHWNTTEELRELWLNVVDRFSTALAGQIDRERASGRALPGPNSRAVAATLLWGTECCLYVAGLGVDPAFSHESEALEPLLAVWMGTIFGTAPAPVKTAPKRPRVKKPAPTEAPASAKAAPATKKTAKSPKPATPAEAPEAKTSTRKRAARRS